MLQYEHKYEAGQSREYTLQAALKQVVSETELKDSYFTTPIALLTAEGQTPHKFNRPNTNGAGDGQGFQGGYNHKGDYGYKKGGHKERGNYNGKGKGKPINKGKHSSLPLATHT